MRRLGFYAGVFFLALALKYSAVRWGGAPGHTVLLSIPILLIVMGIDAISARLARRRTKGAQQ
jgi:hypothetical protein